MGKKEELISRAKKWLEVTAEKDRLLAEVEKLDLESELGAEEEALMDRVEVLDHQLIDLDVHGFVVEVLEYLRDGEP